jgi:hypothetical protein
VTEDAELCRLNVSVNSANLVANLENVSVNRESSRLAEERHAETTGLLREILEELRKAGDGRGSGRCVHRDCQV